MIFLNCGNGQSEMITQHWKSSHTPFEDSRKESVLEFFQLLVAAGILLLAATTVQYLPRWLLRVPDELYT